MYKIKQSADCFILCHVRTAFEEDKEKANDSFWKGVRFIETYLYVFVCFFHADETGGEYSDRALKRSE